MLYLRSRELLTGWYGLPQDAHESVICARQSPGAGLRGTARQPSALPFLRHSGRSWRRDLAPLLLVSVRHEARAASRPGAPARGAARGGRDGRTSSAGPCATPCSACRSRTSTSRSSACRRTAWSRCWRRTGGWTPSGRPSASTSSRASKACPGAVDVALPRRDSKVGPGHRGIAVEGDPVARDRGGRAPPRLHDERDAPRPGDRRDPRPLGRPARPRGPRSCARWTRAPSARTRCARCAPCSSPPATSWRSTRPPPRCARRCRSPSCRPSASSARSRSCCCGRDGRRSASPCSKAWGMLPVIAPELLPLEATPQDPGWHPEGDVWAHTLQVVDEAAALLDDLGDDRPRQLAVMLGALCHDLGKPATTRFEDGRIRSRGHEEAGLSPTTSLLDRWGVHTLLGYDVRAQVLALVAHHLKPGQLFDEREQGERRRDPPPGPQVRARPPLPRGEGRLPRPPARRLRAGGDGVVPRARPRARRGGAPAGAAPQGPGRPRARA